MFSFNFPAFSIISVHQSHHIKGVCLCTGVWGTGWFMMFMMKSFTIPYIIRIRILYILSSHLMQTLSNIDIHNVRLWVVAGCNGGRPSVYIKGNWIFLFPIRTQTHWEWGRGWEWAQFMKRKKISFQNIPTIINIMRGRQKLTGTKCVLLRY